MIIQLKNELSNITDKFDTRSELYILLRSELSRLGYWRNKQRGNPVKGYRTSPVAQQVTEIRKQLKHSGKQSIDINEHQYVYDDN